MAQGTIDWSRSGSGHLEVRLHRQEAYRAVIGRGALQDLPGLVQEVRMDDTVVVVTDDRVAGLLLQRVAAILKATGLRVRSIVVPTGEASKSWDMAQHILSELATHGARRRTLLLALGGGVICDLTGFVASIFMRGLPYVNVPTSLIAQLDAAIGGKVGIDFGGSKNLVGSFHHPAGVLVDPDLMATLPAREIRSGLAEAVKVGILSPDLFSLLERASPALVENLPALTEIVEAAILHKLRLLANDPFEVSLRRSLNLGHTLGHGIEAATEFRTYRHGEAVAIGIAVATEVSHRRGLCATETRDRIQATLRACGLGLRPPIEILPAILAELDTIRRIRNGKLYEVLPRGIGTCDVVDEVDDAEYAAAFDALSRRSPAALLEISGDRL